MNGALGNTYVKRESSLENGMEIVSHPATLAYHMSKKMDQLASFQPQTPMCDWERPTAWSIPRIGLSPTPISASSPLRIFYQLPLKLVPGFLQIANFS